MRHQDVWPAGGRWKCRVVKLKLTFSLQFALLQQLVVSQHKLCAELKLCQKIDVSITVFKL
jgi:hypothetical protein